MLEHSSCALARPSRKACMLSEISRHTTKPSLEKGRPGQEWAAGDGRVKDPAGKGEGGGG